MAVACSGRMPGQFPTPAELCNIVTYRRQCI
jgi:hypothetical protein